MNIADDIKSAAVVHHPNGIAEWWEVRLHIMDGNCDLRITYAGITQDVVPAEVMIEAAKLIRRWLQA
jgi:hypothetical protein